MKRYIFEIQYNKNDEKKLWDKVFIDADNPAFAKAKIKYLYPGIFKNTILSVLTDRDY